MNRTSRTVRRQTATRAIKGRLLAPARDEAFARMRQQYRIPVRQGIKLLFREVRCEVVGVPSDGSLTILVKNELGEILKLHPTWEVEYLWPCYRCRTCGRWSHDSHGKPRSHVRYSTDWVEAERFPHTVETFGGEDGGDLYRLECGPVDTFEARRNYYADREESTDARE